MENQLKSILNLLKYDIELAQQFIDKAYDEEDKLSAQYWIGWKSAKEQDLVRIERVVQLMSLK